ncbi:atu genes transcriptional repressor AtuR [Maricurvus nonylphenolicus]|uniref:TetR/AcrR family transcriptional regulator n=1 Tax=Maricurvus nonylphenolicus TaxID=1008307 RepID=UPI0036F2AC40
MTGIAQLVEEGLVTEPDSAKGRLIKAAGQLFKEKGYARTTVRDLAAEVGILSGSLFHHFPNKEAILRAVIEEAIHRVLAQMYDALAKVEDPVEKLRAMVRCEGHAINNDLNPGFQIMASEWRSLNPENQESILVLRREYEGLWKKVLDTLFQQGLINVEGSFTRHFIRGALIESHNWYDVDGKLTLEQLEDKLIQALVHSP